MRIPISTFYAGLIQLLGMIGIVAVLHSAGLGMGWAFLASVVVLAVLAILVWLLVAGRWTDGMPRRVLAKVVIVNVSLVVVSPLVPLARWLHGGLGLSKQLAGGIFIVLAVILLFVVFGVVGKVAAGSKRQQNQQVR